MKPSSPVFALFLMVLSGMLVLSRPEPLIAAVTPVQIAVAGPVQIFGKDWSVYGLRLTMFHSENRNVYGFDFSGAVSISSDDGGGVQVSGLFSLSKNYIGLRFSGLASVYTEGFYGLSVSGLCNADSIFIHGGSTFVGVQIAGIFNTVSHVKGLQVAGLWNRGAGNISGIQIAGLCNIDKNDVFSDGRMPEYTGLSGFQLSALYNQSDEVNGVQVGLVNRARRIRGVQIGLVNIAGRMSGIQIGLVNIIEEGAIPFLPIFNASMTF